MISPALRVFDDQEQSQRCFVTENPMLEASLEQLDIVAAKDFSVLLTGPSGCGKTVLAQDIHRLSARAEGPFVRVDCTAIPLHLAESLLFGHRKGAFTGASANYEGRIRPADGGTLFLDEIGDLPMELQGKLLRVVEERTFAPVGAVDDIQVDFRCISATKYDLGQLVEEGRFREDLYFRLANWQVQIPPLCDRPEDVELLLARFFEETKKRPEERLSPEAHEALISHSWSGNARELLGTLKVADALAGLNRIETRHLNLGNSSQASSNGARRRVDVNVGDSLAETTRKLTQATFRVFEGNKSKTAATLGIARQTLERHLAQSEERSGESRHTA